ncbi:MAG: hypothetical protein WKG01_33580 [Kofleriaceae bacterium]
MRARTIILMLAVMLIGMSLAIAKPRPKKKKRPKKAVPAAPVEPPDEPAPTPDPEPTPTIPPTFPPPTTPGQPPVGAGSGSGSAAPAEIKPKEPEPTKQVEAGPDVDSLRQEYLALRDELFKSRARANAVASQLYSTRVQIKLTYTTARYYNPAKATIRLDGATVYENAAGAIGGDDGIRFDGYIAPGRHLITFRVEATGKDDDTFTSVTETQVVVKAVANKDLMVVAKARDSGNIAYEWKKSERGSYGLGIDVAVKTTARAAGENKK